MRKKKVVGNWKMHGSLAANVALLQGLRHGVAGAVEGQVGVAVPFPYLAQAKEFLLGSPIAWGAQNLSEKSTGAFTGEVSGEMIRDFGASFVLVGHSERRSLYGEADGLVAAKAAQALSCGLQPIVCVGETLNEREAGQTFEVIQRQLAAVIDRLGAAGLAKSILAYEPVWAIGTGKTASPAQAQEVHAAIRQQLSATDHAVAASTVILYGGSVKAGNAAELFDQPDVDGGLVGGASLVADEFLGIVRAAI